MNNKIYLLLASSAFLALPGIAQSATVDNQDHGKVYSMVEVLNPPKGKQVLILKSETTDGDNKISTIQVFSSDCKDGKVNLDSKEYFFNDTKVDNNLSSDSLTTEKSKFVYDLMCKK